MGVDVVVGAGSGDNCGGDVGAGQDNVSYSPRLVVVVKTGQMQRPVFLKLALPFQ